MQRVKCKARKEETWVTIKVHTAPVPLQTPVVWFPEEQDTQTGPFQMKLNCKVRSSGPHRTRLEAAQSKSPKMCTGWISTIFRPAPLGCTRLLTSAQSQRPALAGIQEWEDAQGQQSETLLTKRPGRVKSGEASK